MVYCDGCDEQCHEFLEVRWETREPVPRVFVACPWRDDLGPVPVPLSSVQRWRIDLRALANMLAEDLDADGTVEEIVEGWLWWLGIATFRAGRMDVFMARGLAEEGGAEKIGSAPRFRQCTRGLVLDLGESTGDLFAEKATISLHRILFLRDRTVHLDREVLGAEVARRFGGRLRQIPKYPTPPGTTWEQAEIVILADGDGAILNAGAGGEERTPHQMGLAHARNPSKRSVLWRLLLLLAEEKAIGVDSKNRSSAIPKRIERLRRRLHEVFGIDDDPFKPYHEVRGYEPRFVIRRIR